MGEWGVLRPKLKVDGPGPSLEYLVTSMYRGKHDTDDCWTERLF